VSRPRGQHKHVAGRHLERLSLRPAELDRRPAGYNRERLMRRRVEVVKAEHAVHPRAAPAVPREQPPGGVSALGRGVDAAVDQHREACVVRDPVPGRRVPGLELHAFVIPTRPSSPASGTSISALLPALRGDDPALARRVRRPAGLGAKRGDATRGCAGPARRS